MKIKEIRNSKAITHKNEITLTGTITSNKENSDFGEPLYALHPFGAESLVPLVVETSTTQQIKTDDGFDDVRKHIFNVNIYGDLIDKVVENEDFYIGSRVEIKGFLISKNYSKTDERADIMNLCNRYKNLNGGERPFLMYGKRPFVDKETGEKFQKHLIDWEKLLCEGLLEVIPDEEAQDAGKVEYFYIEDGRVFRQEHKTNYIVIAKEITAIDNYLDTSKGDINRIEISGRTKDIYVTSHSGYELAHICLICRSSDMTRDSYIHAYVRGQNLDKIRSISVDDIVYIKGKVKHKVIEKTFEIKKGKKEFTSTLYSNLYEIDAKELIIYKDSK